MNASLLVLCIYFLFTLCMGLGFRKKAGLSLEEFYLAGRNVRGLLLFFTMAATNFSAFTIFGLSGAGYRIGYAFFPVMAFGTGFMALSFILIGGKIHTLSSVHGYITPSDYIFHRYSSRPLKILVSTVLIFFTLPYIAIQAVGGGKSIQMLTGLSYGWGAFLVTGFIILYVLLGGMRSIIWTDCIQGIMMIGFTLAAFIIIVVKSGGAEAISSTLIAQSPEHFYRPGSGGVITPGVWFGYLILWFFADPMFPQLFQRFMIARGERSFRTTVVLYPLVTTFLFFLTISIGVIGRAQLPDLAPSQVDSIFPLLLRNSAGGLLGTILLTGSLAALMSTMDSQLLSLTSIIQRDFGSREKEGKKGSGTRTGRLVVMLLGTAGFLIALNPPDNILNFINGTTFNGLSVLAPTVIGGLYWKRGNAAGALASIVAGETLVVLYYSGIFSCTMVHPVIPILTFASGVYILVSLIQRREPRQGSALIFRFDRRLLFFFLFVAAASDLWNWGRPPEVFFLGLPLWVWWQVLLGGLLSTAYFLYMRAKEPEKV